jgi:hypothetical protein
METLQGSMNSGVLWGACKPLQCNSTCNNIYIYILIRRRLVKWKKYKKEIWKPRKKFLETEALAQFERKFGIKNGVSEENFGPITGPKLRHQRGRKILINSLYFLKGTGSLSSPGRQPVPERKGGNITG